MWKKNTRYAIKKIEEKIKKKNSKNRKNKNNKINTKRPK